MTRRPRVIVCGTGFGRIHLRAVRSSPDVELAGVLARGSDQSRRIASEHGVTCFTDVDDLPGDVDIACVVVTGGTGGGDGTVLALRLLARGIHVMQELPLHRDELESCLRAAREHGVHYRVNAFHPHLAPVRRFLDAAEVARRRQRPLFVDTACAIQVLPSLLDIVGRAVGGLRPWRFADPDTVPPELAALAGTPAPYSTVHGVIGEVPVTLRVQNQINPSDLDNHALLLHRVSVGFEGGVLSLADTHGPVLWSPRLHGERDATGRLVLSGPETGRLGVSSTQRLDGAKAPGAQDPTFLEIFDRVWPDAVVHALREFQQDIAGSAGAPQPAKWSQWALSLTAQWQDLSARLGPPEPIHPPEPQPLPLPELLAELQQEGR
ncbi:thiazolinyl imide reductase [Nonomuraea longispora]|uniref:Thiazolinyl imide reductase n=1 Tax=Nonomuraea longispora TaxID=1848320 RepID=A0A4R4NLN0_9ACTN|nr:Gfo/Idh/MocA family oxidoreductase [Nonomuraea longispora]TDC07912.1 thiazolinyl imide reductase [Nonomuraea longispora]